MFALLALLSLAHADEPTAALERPNGTIWLFRADGIDVATADGNVVGTVSMTEAFDGWAPDVPIDAAMAAPNGKSYLFFGDQYVRFGSSATSIDDGYPKPIAGAWPGLGWDEGLDAAVAYPNGYAYFFKGDWYLKYNLAEDHAVEGYAKAIQGSWPGLPTSGFAWAAMTGRTSAWIAANGTVYAYDTNVDRATGTVEIGGQPTAPPAVSGGGMCEGAEASEGCGAAKVDCDEAARGAVIKDGRPVAYFRPHSGNFYSLWARQCGQTIPASVIVDPGKWVSRKDVKDIYWVVLHETGTPDTKYGPTQTDGSNAVHFFLAANGDMYQVADLGKRFNHASNETINSASIGVEIAQGGLTGLKDDNGFPTYGNPVAKLPSHAETTAPTWTRINWMGSVNGYYLPQPKQMEVLAELVEFINNDTSGWHSVPKVWASANIDPGSWAVTGNGSKCMPGTPWVQGRSSMEDMALQGGYIHHAFIGEHFDGSFAALYTWLVFQGNSDASAYAWTTCLLATKMEPATSHPAITGLDCEHTKVENKKPIKVKDPPSVFRVLGSKPATCGSLPPLVMNKPALKTLSASLAEESYDQPSDDQPSNDQPAEPQQEEPAQDEQGW